MASEDRYADRPLLRLIESYALAVIDHLPGESEEAVRLVVQRVFEDAGDDWMATLRSALHWGPSVDATIRENWLAYQDAANAAGVQNSAEEFAVLFADAVEKADEDDD